ncbi:dihydrodipicolinate synthase family protein [Streptomyces sp. NPDC056716]|uniref:dihydrodipicolinate synthase family protein n=1 Tax=unclassified Streptomyces TaxID=2593676 RepID=UPI0036BC0A97
MSYSRLEARAWARENMKGICGCLLPTFTSDLSKVNERAVRHDIGLEKQLGMSSALIVSECGTTFEELLRITEVAVDEAGDDLQIVVHAALPTLQDNIRLVQESEKRGATYVLLSYPLTFYPRTEQEVFDYTKAVADSTNLGVIVFAMHLWNFRRLHPSHFSPRLIGRMIDEIPNVVAVKSEVGGPGVGGIAEIFHKYRDQVIVMDPIESNSPAWHSMYGMQWMGTSNYEAYGPWVARYFDLMREGRFDDAMEIYWRIHPVREADSAVVGQAVAGTAMVHRYLWKYQGWLNGFNGGPLRAPLSRINDGQMAQLRAAAVAGGLDVTDSPDHEFFTGRNPA